MPKIILIAHDIRSVHNVGSLLRTAEGLGVSKVYLTGYTPHPNYPGDLRLPHIGRRQRAQISKTSLGAENSQSWEYKADIADLIDELKTDGFEIIGLEQDKRAKPLTDFIVPEKVALLLGREVEGIDHSLLTKCEQVVFIPMFGSKESFNVVQAAAMTMYQFRFFKG